MLNKHTCSSYFEYCLFNLLICSDIVVKIIANLKNSSPLFLKISKYKVR